MTNENRDVGEFLAQVKPLKGDYVYYSRQKRELSYLCGIDAWEEKNRPEVYALAERKLIEFLEV